MKKKASQKWQEVIPKWKYPPNKDIQERYFGHNFWEIYRSQFNARTIGHPGYADLTLHTILGQIDNIKKMRIMVDENEVDLRISSIYWKPSGSGGGRGYNFTAQIMNGVARKNKDHYPFQHMTIVNDGSVVGSIRQIKQVDPVSKSEKYVTNFEYGWLWPGWDINILAHNEASMLFDKSKFTEHSKKVVHFFQIALNPMGTIDNQIVKKLTFGDAIRYHPECSVFLISYPPPYEQLLKQLFGTGFVPRCVVLHNEFTLDERKEHIQLLTKKIGKKTKKIGRVGDIIQALKFMNRFYEGKKSLGITKDARGALDDIVEEIFKPLYQMPEHSRKPLEDFAARWIEHLWKCAWHHACTRLSLDVEKQDIAHARAFILPLWKHIVYFCEDTFIIPKHQKTRWMRHVQFMKVIYDAILEANPKYKAKGEKQDFVPRTLMKKKLASRDTGWGISEDTASKRMAKAEKEGYMVRNYFHTTKPWVKWINIPKWFD